MKKVMFIFVFTVATLGLVAGSYAAEVTLGPDLKVPISLEVARAARVGAIASVPRHPTILPLIPS